MNAWSANNQPSEPSHIAAHSAAMAESSSRTLLLVAATSAAAGALLSYLLQQRRAAENRMEASEVPAVENGHAASNEELASEPPSDPYDPAPRQG